jgi:putative DNA-invertase from lambdoid prophage Rac
MTAIRTIKQSLTTVPESRARVAVYLRVSTDSQTVDNQIPDIERYIATITRAEVTYYSENESSWRQGHQSELARLKEDIRSGKRKYDIFILWAFDRLTREGGIALIKEYEFFLRYNVRVVSIKEPWLDVPKEFLPVMLSLVGYIAQMESKRKSERIKAGNARKAKQENWTPGRRKGAKDNGKRRTRGYIERWNKINVVTTLVTTTAIG